jgi:tRNA/tmRNA/rRNA uracil-C5-methylase (TrmA/RlmC/RlmD family)
MAQPTTPPLSLRVPPPLLSQIDAWAERKGCARHAAILLLIERGLGGGAVTVAGVAPKPSFSHGRSKTVVVETKRQRVEAPKHVSRLKGEWKAP